jgi:phage terminase large subunit
MLRPDDLVLVREQKRRQRQTLNLVPTFRGACLEAQTMTAHEWINAGPAETGKTFSLLWRLDSLLRATPRARAAIVRKVRADMDGTVLETWERVIEIRGGVSTFGGESAKFYDYPNGSRVHVGGMDRPGKTLSSERDFIYVNQAEELALEDWEFLLRPTTGRGAVTATPMLFGDCNPGPPDHWIKRRASIRLLESVHQDNPTLFRDDGTPTEQWLQRTGPILESMTGVRRDRLYLGLWVAAEGAVYAYQPKYHLIDETALPEIKRWIVSIDFGYTNPFVAQLWGLDSDDRMYLVSEIYRTRRIVEDHARDIKAMVGGRRVEIYIADHDAEDRATLERHGIKTIAAQKAVTVGIQAVQARMVVQPDGKPRLFIVRGALVERDENLVTTKKPVCTEQEFPEYVWAKDASGRPLKEEPVKVNDHGMDACRYAAVYASGDGRSSVVAETVKSPPRGTRGVF